MKIPEPIHSTVAAIYSGIKANHDDRLRGHLGASEIGHDCDRYLWLKFHWAFYPDFEGRILRLFRRGHLEEEQVIKDLRNAGMQVYSVDSNGNQFRFVLDENHHFSGSCDGFIKSGVPESPKKPHVLEIKTSSAKYFADLQKNGVEKAQPKHYLQMQIYMDAFNIDRALYISVCKDDDQIYTERVKLDQLQVDNAKAKAIRIITESTPPEKISVDPTWYKCKMCDAYKLCHKQQVPEVNCRTCANSTPLPDGTWQCEKYSNTIPEEFQRNGCESHLFNPYILPYEWKQNGTVESYDVQIKDRWFTTPDYFSSSDLRNINPDAIDDFMLAIKDTFGAKINAT